MTTLSRKPISQRAKNREEISRVVQQGKEGNRRHFIYKASKQTAKSYVKLFYDRRKWKWHRKNNGNRKPSSFVCFRVFSEEKPKHRLYTARKLLGYCSVSSHEHANEISNSISSSF